VQLKFEFPLRARGARCGTRRTAQVILIVPEEYGPRFGPRSLRRSCCSPTARTRKTRKSADRARLLLAGYGSGIAQSGCRFGGESAPGHAGAVNDIDVATPTGGPGRPRVHDIFRCCRPDGPACTSHRLTAGERGARIAEALLSLPVAASLVGGKILATCSYMCASLAISLAAFVVVFRSSPRALGMSANLGVGTALAFFAICLPFVPWAA